MELYTGAIHHGVRYGEREHRRHDQAEDPRVVFVQEPGSHLGARGGGDDPQGRRYYYVRTAVRSATLLTSAVGLNAAQGRKLGPVAAKTWSRTLQLTLYGYWNTSGGQRSGGLQRSGRRTANSNKLKVFHIHKSKSII
eukprot:1395505-Amorphochlora_amoeboformis.AAC.1